MRWFVGFLFCFFSSFAFADGEGAGGGAGGNQQKGGDQKPGDQKPIAGITLTREEYDRLMANQKPKDDKDGGGDGKGGKDKNGNDPILDRVAADKKDKEQTSLREKQMEGALKFNLSSDKFIKEYESILPKDISEIFAAAAKEKYDSQIDQANATKASLMKSFFSQQVNLDVLTENQKAAVEDFLKLSATARQEKSAELYSGVFEPVLEMLKRVKKAEQVAKANNGQVDSNDSDKAFKDRMIKGSHAHYLGVKS